MKQNKAGIEDFVSRISKQVCTSREGETLFNVIYKS